MTLDDFIALTGQEIGVSRWFEITQDRIDAFADATEDHQYIHTDPEAAAKTPFGGTIAHGFLTLSLLSAMTYDGVPKVDGTVMGVNYGMNRMRFLSPVKVGSRVRGRFTLKEVDTSRPNEFTTITDVSVEIENEDKPALVAEWIGRRYLESTT
ncbi:MaoC family dehydratase [Maritimibacter sp. UBA3975]|uniref:MaoC family dehydratase n=1 Tax=Maritimibacter sp. UBA3975 TaxID=1946833 RepID=UPI000C0920BE|nr:MaoC family dehydratase [Maritimibacter sp. UBA3975]MAM62037.1 nodulation protein NodN [Maritimibacter sp.]|tara:strand:- start:10570 stop:11028 length:459 start_codon:yes stop_codon:yes gene_type:complete